MAVHSAHWRPSLIATLMTMTMTRTMMMVMVMVMMVVMTMMVMMMMACHMDKPLRGQFQKCVQDILRSTSIHFISNK